MAINLTKGQRVDVGLRNVAVGLGWNPNPQASSHDYDLDASAFMLGENGSVKSAGDNRTGDGDGDDETINVAPKMGWPSEASDAIL